MNKLAITLASAVLVSVAACSQKSEPQQPQTTAPAQPPVQQPMQQPEAPQAQQAPAAPVAPQTNLSAGVGGHPAGVPTQMNSAPQIGANAGQGKVLQSMHASSYTYIEVDMGSKKTWIATNAMPVNTGATVRWRDGAAMKNFTSNALHRTFDEILFVSYAEVVK